MLFDLFRSEGRGRLEQIEAKIQTMLEHDRREFDLAMAALLGQQRASAVNDEIRSTDGRVNELEREIRRELLVHVSAFGGVDTPAVLIHMSIVKDIERVGDYAKNLVDLARDGANFGTLDDADEWRGLATDVSAYIADAGAAFQAYTPDRSRDLHARGERFLRHFDDRVSRLVRGEDDGPQGVARALAYRYLKRVVAHLMNLLSAVIMPLDRLDQFDEDPEDRIPD